MINLKLAGIILALSTVIAGPAVAQPVISEPGAFAFYNPNGDVLQMGSNPGGAANAMASMRGSEMSMMPRHHGRAIKDPARVPQTATMR